MPYLLIILCQKESQWSECVPWGDQPNGPALAKEKN